MLCNGPTKICTVFPMSSSHTNPACLSASWFPSWLKSKSLSEVSRRSWWLRTWWIAMCVHDGPIVAWISSCIKSALVSLMHCSSEIPSSTRVKMPIAYILSVKISTNKLCDIAKKIALSSDLSFVCLPRTWLRRLSWKHDGQVPDFWKISANCERSSSDTEKSKTLHEAKAPSGIRGVLQLPSVKNRLICVQYRAHDIAPTLIALHTCSRLQGTDKRRRMRWMDFSKNSLYLWH